MKKKTSLTGLNCRIRSESLSELAFLMDLCTGGINNIDKLCTLYIFAVRLKLIFA